MAFIIQTINQKIQGIDNAYTIQGWLKGVNSNKLTSEADIGNDGKNDGIHNYIPGDQFGFSLGYFDGDYTPRAETDLASTDKFMLNHYFENSLYNGNITHMSSSIRHFMFDEEETDPQPSTFEYQYDQLNRILSSTHRNWLLETPTTTDTRWLSNYTYDLNGNIETLNRYDQNGTQFDQMNYNYGYTKDTDDWLNDDSEIDMEENNRLLSVDDLSLISIGVDITDQNPLNYSYDAIGNLVSDFKEEIEHIEWSVTGKIKKITRIENSQKDDLEFLYDPSGQRIAKVAKPRPTGSPSPENAWIITWYVRDASGNVMSTYDQSYSGNFAGPGENPCPASSYTSKFTIRWSEAHIYGSSRLGMEMEGIKVYESGAEMNPTTEEMEISGANCIVIESNHVFSQELGDKRFELANHLGNVMVVLSDKRIAQYSGDALTSYTAEVMMATDYYPFGMVMSGRQFTSTGSYRFGFQNQEEDQEFWDGAVSYKYRIEDPRLGRFFSVDPLASKYAYNSPYAFSENRVIDSVELEGLERVDCDNEVVGNTYFQFTDAGLSGDGRSDYISNYESGAKSMWADKAGYGFSNVQFKHYNGEVLGPDDILITVGPAGSDPDGMGESHMNTDASGAVTGFMVYTTGPVMEAGHEYGHAFGLEDRYFSAFSYGARSMAEGGSYFSPLRQTLPMNELMLRSAYGISDPEYVSSNNLYSNGALTITSWQRYVFENKNVSELNVLPSPVIITSLLGRSMRTSPDQSSSFFFNSTDNTLTRYAGSRSYNSTPWLRFTIASGFSGAPPVFRDAFNAASGSDLSRLVTSPEQQLLNRVRLWSK